MVPGPQLRVQPLTSLVFLGPHLLSLLSLLRQALLPSSLFPTLSPPAPPVADNPV